MEKKIVFSTIALVVVVISLLLMVPDKAANTPDTLPWNIAHPTPDTTRVFNVTLGVTSLGEVEKTFKEVAEISLFKPSSGGKSVEAFYEEVNFNGLKAKIIMTVAVPTEELQGIYERGLRLNNDTSGKHITMTYNDLEHVRTLPVSSLTYLPNLSIDEVVITKRFGEPAQRIREKNTEIVHWLYPQQGLDIVRSGKEKPVLQYVSPKNFELLRAPLLAKGEVLK